MRLFLWWLNGISHQETHEKDKAIGVFKRIATTLTALLTTLLTLTEEVKENNDIN